MRLRGGGRGGRGHLKEGVWETTGDDMNENELPSNSVSYNT